MAEPLVTVIILAAHREHLLSNTLNSVKAQSYPHIQIIVTGSNEEAMRRVTDDIPGIELLTENASTDARFLNRAWQKARGNYLAILETGNLWYPEFLAVQLEMLQSGKADLTIANGLEETIGPNPVVLFQVRKNYRKFMSQAFDNWHHPTDEELQPMLIGEQLPPISGFLFRKSLFNRGWDEEFNRYHHQAALAAILTENQPSVAICRSRLWFRRLDPLTHLQPLEHTIREGAQSIAEAKRLLKHESISKQQSPLLKDSISLQYRLLALSCRKAGQQAVSLNYMAHAIRYNPEIMKNLLQKSKTYFFRSL